MTPEIEALFEERLGILEKSFEAGVIAALPEAIQYCCENELPPPIWVGRANMRLVYSVLCGDFSRKRGETRFLLPHRIANWKHTVRFDAVNEVREYQRTDYRKILVASRNPRYSKEQKRQFMSTIPKYVKGATLVDAYYAASEMLSKSFAFGSPSTVKQSYLRVHKAMKDPSQMFRYHVPDLRTLKAFGIEL